MTWHIHEGFTLSKIGDFLWLRCGDDEELGFHIDQIDDVIDALKRAKRHIQADKIRETEEIALARWGRERTPTE